MQFFKQGSRRFSDENWIARGRDCTGAWYHGSFVQGRGDRRTGSQPIAAVSQCVVSVSITLPQAPSMPLSLSHSVPWVSALSPLAVWSLVTSPSFLPLSVSLAATPEIHRDNPCVSRCKIQKPLPDQCKVSSQSFNSCCSHHEYQFLPFALYLLLLFDDHSHPSKQLNCSLCQIVGHLSWIDPATVPYNFLQSEKCKMQEAEPCIAVCIK